jgi:hypothetical protein
MTALTTAADVHPTPAGAAMIGPETRLTSEGEVMITLDPESHPTLARVLMTILAGVMTISLVPHQTPERVLMTTLAGETMTNLVRHQTLERVGTMISLAHPLIPAKVLTMTSLEPHPTLARAVTITLAKERVMMTAGRAS